MWAMGHGTCDNMNWAGLLQHVLVIIHLRQIVCSSSQFFIPEEQEAGTRVGTLSRDFWPPFKLLNLKYLWADENTGDLYTTEQTMDRETLCPQEMAGECIIPHNAIVGPLGDLVQFHVVLEDINDNPPRFEISEIHLSLAEDIAVGSSIVLDDQARDSDSASNGELQYNLQGSEGFFRLSVEKESTVVTLVVQSALDREIQEQHIMSLVATDGGSEPLSAMATLIVKVTDVNDNCPRFDPDGDRSVTVTGDSHRGIVVTQVKASDPDLGLNAAITYSLSSKVSERAKKLFSLDRHTGHIRLTQDLQSDSAEELVLQVLASGHYCPPADTQVTVSVLPSARHVPAIKIGFIAEHQNRTIMLQENQPPTVLALLELRGENGFNSSAIIMDNKVPFTLNPQNGKYLLSSSKPLDYEMKSEYLISVGLSRPSTGGQMSSGPRQEIRVMVVDVNDNTPQFQQSHYHLEVEENIQPTGPVLAVKATDVDSGLNGRVTYRLGKYTSAIFKMDLQTGQLSVAVPLDREQQDVHTVTVLAQDGGSPPLESVTTVSVYVRDQNDNAPVFVTPHFIFFITENIPPLAHVGKIGVSDADEGHNGNVDVRVVNNSAPFVIDNTHRTLRCTTNVDRETVDRYELHLLANDRGHPFPMTSVAKVTVFVEDVNDNQPKVILPNSNLSCLTVSPATKAGTTVTKIYATDEDSGLNSEITYTIAAQEPAPHSSPFRLDSTSGNITLAQRLLGKDLGMHHLFVVVSDGGKPSPLHTTVWVNLLVNETVEPCHLDSLPRSLPFRMAQTPSEAAICDAKYAHLMLLVGLGMMLASICLFVVAAVLYLKLKRQQLKGQGQHDEKESPLRHVKNYYDE